MLIAKVIRNHNKTCRDLKTDFKRLNPWLYVIFNSEELELLKENEQEYNYASHNKLKKVS